MGDKEYYLENCKELNMGFLKLPPGYTIFKNNNGYHFWYNEINDTESVISWDRFAVLRGAWADYRKSINED